MFSTTKPKSCARSALLGLGLLMVSNGIAFGQPVPGYTELPGISGYRTLARAVANQGRVTAGYLSQAVAPFDTDAFRWTPENGLTVYSESPFPPRSVIYAITGDGAFMAGAGFVATPEGLRSRAARWDSAGAYQVLGLLGGDERSVANAISADGQIVVGTSIRSESQIRERAFYWSPSTQIVQIPDLRPNGVMTTARDVSANGQFVVGSSKSDSVFAQDYAFIWSAANGSRELATPADAGDAIATSVNADGTVVAGLVSMESGPTQPVRWVNGVMEFLGNVAGYDNGGSVFSISDNGGVIVGDLRATSASGLVDSAFVVTPQWGMLQANDFFGRHGITLPATVFEITDVSPDGTAFSIDLYDSLNDGIVVIPSPASTAPLALLLACAFRRRR